MTAPACTVCAIARNEGPYLLEWIAWQHLLGFEKILIYDNSADRTDRILDALHAAGAIGRIPWPDRPGAAPQLPAYADALARARTDWIAFLDIDEFLLLPHHASIAAFLARFAPDDTQVAINQRVFGANGLAHRDDRLVIERFTRACLPTNPYNAWCKSIARVAAIAEPGVHASRMADGRTVDSAGRPVAVVDDRLPTAQFGIAQVNHYILKSREEFATRIARGNSMRPRERGDASDRCTAAFFEAHDRNDVECPQAAARARRPCRNAPPRPGRRPPHPGPEPPGRGMTAPAMASRHRPVLPLPATRTWRKP